MTNQSLEQFIAQELKNEAKQLGRKVDPNSERQKRLAELAAKRESGDFKRGRPINGESARQARLAELAEKRENGELRKGRPVSGDSERQKRLAEREAKAAAGVEVKRGRPAAPKVVTEVVVTSDIVDLEDK
jgi:hypothetical protein